MLHECYALRLEVHRLLLLSSLSESHMTALMSDVVLTNVLPAMHRTLLAGSLNAPGYCLPLSRHRGVPAASEVSARMPASARP